MRDPRTDEPAPLHKRGENTADDDRTGITGFFESDYQTNEMTTLPTIEEIQAEATRLHELKLIAWASISLNIRPHTGLAFWSHAPTEKLDPIESLTLEGLEQAARDMIAKHDPKAKLRDEADKLGFELVEKSA